AAAGRRLNPGGTLYLVANEPLPYEASLRALGKLRELRREGGFKVLAAMRAS
ncbi:MAG: methyltransferase, partial [Deinococcota bacterium]